jgi:uncharacterized membrane protein
MILHARDVWHRHPAVRTGSRLTLGERAADVLKHWFGTWTALGCVAGVIVIWVALQITSLRWDTYPFILLNLCLSCLAAVQGIILQISANRGDRISSEVAVHTSDNTGHVLTLSQKIYEMQHQQLEILNQLRHISAELDLVRETRGEPDPRVDEVKSEGENSL